MKLKMRLLSAACESREISQPQSKQSEQAECVCVCALAVLRVAAEAEAAQAAAKAANAETATAPAAAEISGSASCGQRGASSLSHFQALEELNLNLEPRQSWAAAAAAARQLAPPSAAGSGPHKRDKIARCIITPHFCWLAAGRLVEIGRAHV